MSDRSDNEQHPAERRTPHLFSVAAAVKRRLIPSRAVCETSLSRRVQQLHSRCYTLHSYRTPVRRSVLPVALLAISVTASAAEPSASDLAFFESKIRPLLAEHCYSCHSTKAEKLKGGLYVDSRAGLLTGGDSGPAIVPRDAEKSLLMKAVRSTDADLQMPPRKGGGKKPCRPPDRRPRAMDQDWSALACGRTSQRLATDGVVSRDHRKDKSWWAFQPIRRPALPLINRKSQIANPIDAFAQFIKEQIAGDELDRVTFDSIIATGFQRLGVWDDEPDDKRMAEFDELDDVLSTTGSAFLGLTIGCARCHDHKFDPIPQADYYQLLGFFVSV